MAKFELKNKIETDGEDFSHHTIVVTFDNPNHVPEKTEKVTSSVVVVDKNDEPVLDDNGEYQYEDKEVEVTHEAVGEPQLTFEQDVILPDSKTDEAAQAYADDYEKSFNELHKEN